MGRRIFILWFLLLPAFTNAQKANTPTSWELTKEKDGITIHTRWHKVTEDREAREMRGEMIVDVPVANIVQLIKDDKKAHQWMMRIKEFKNVKVVDDYIWYSYSQMSIPWPFNNQDMITKNSLKIGADGTVKVVLEGAPEMVPVIDGVRRIEHFEGGWTLRPISGKRVKITYSMFNNSKPVAPSFITDPLVIKGFWSTLNDMRDLLLAGKDKKVNLPYLKP